MPNGIVSKETFEDADEATKLNLLFDIAIQTHKDIKKIQGRKLFNTTAAFAGGIVGGFAAITAKWVFWGQLK